MQAGAKGVLVANGTAGGNHGDGGSGKNRAASCRGKAVGRYGHDEDTPGDFPNILPQPSEGWNEEGLNF